MDSQNREEVDKHNKMMIHIDTLMDEMDNKNKVMEDLRKDIDKAYDLIRALCLRIDSVENLIEEQDAYILRKRNNITLLSQNVTEQQMEWK